MKALPTLLRSLGVSALAALGISSAFAQDVGNGAMNPTQSKAAMCIGCHGIPGYQASFPEVHKVPKISGQSEAYLVAALAGYRKGDRKHPTMKAVAASLTDADISELASFYAKHGDKSTPAPAPTQAPSAEIQALLSKGNCLACHGENLSKPIDPSYPKLAGQHADYLYVALKSYRSGGSALIGRNNPIMSAQVQSFTPRELKLLAQHIASLPGELRTVSQSRTR